MQFEYPLQWLPQQPRTKYPQGARFGNYSIAKSGDYLIEELERMGAKGCVISSNLQRKQRGEGLLSNQRIDDAGVVIYFNLKEQQKAMACDKWNKPEHNLWALYLSIKAIRGLERWGGSEFLDGLFKGFKALPPPKDAIISQIDYFVDISNIDELKERFRSLAKELHPDSGGNASEFNIMQKQYKEKLSQMEGSL